MGVFNLFTGIKKRTKKAQTTVEYLLLLATIAGGTIIFFILFYRKIIGVFFTLVGLILGAGTPK